MSAGNYTSATTRVQFIMDSAFSSLGKLLQLDLGTAGGLFLYGMTFIMFFVPLAIFYFEYRLEAKKQRQQEAETKKEKLKASKPPLPPATVITALQVYPVKSCRGIPLQSAKLLKTGLDLDRKWMFVDADNKFITIRENSKMTLIKTAIIPETDELHVHVQHDGSEIAFTVPAHPSAAWLRQNTTLVTNARIWGTVTDAHMYSTSLTDPFEAFFGKPVRFVMKAPTPRALTSNGAEKVLGRKESTMFADMMPILVVNEQSLRELNERLAGIGKGPITWEHYRPNIIVRGDLPWNEDLWKTVRMSGEEGEAELIMDVTQRCARCQVPNIDPETGIPDAKEPFNLTMKYRRVDPGITFRPCFGMLCAPRLAGELRVGMKFEVTETTDEHVYLKG